MTDQAQEVFIFRLYIAGQSKKSLTAIANLRKICEEHLPDRYKIEIIDLLQDPSLASDDQIIAIPTLVRKLPDPVKRVVGDLSRLELSSVGIEVRSSSF